MSDLKVLTSGDLPQLPKRPLNAFKTSVGSVLIVAGSYGMAGAAYLTAAATLAGGAGYVRVATPKSVYPILAQLVPSAVFIPLDCTDDGIVKASAYEKILKEYGPSKVAVVGPGFGDKPPAAELFYTLLEKLPIPKVLDANVLGLIGKRQDLFRLLTPADILTPHPGEAGDLLGIKGTEVQSDRRKAVTTIVERTGAICVLKGARTLVCDGKRLYTNTSGNAGMAKAGSGDVLSGVIAAFVAQDVAPFDAACLSVYIHGKAGDIAAGQKGRGMTAEDIIAALPLAISRYEGGIFERGGVH